MRVIVKEGHDILFLEGCHFDKEYDSENLTINLNNKWIYISSSFKRNHLIIETTEGIIYLTFSIKLHNLEFLPKKSDKDQLVFKLIKE